ncbi:MAG: sigma factor-like helix-turn-helix DNA-binding protein [Patescibacteria group bacterium]
MNSILEKVLLSQEITERQKLSPVDICTQLLKLLTNREADVLRLRFGLDGNGTHTLEIIGKRYTITRERVRQIEHQSIQKLKQSKQFQEISEGISTLVTHNLTQHGGMRRQDVLLNDLLSLSGDSSVNRNCLSFIIEQLLNTAIEEIKSEAILPSWKLKEFSSQLFTETIASIESLLESKGQPVSFDALLNEFLRSNFYQEHAQEYQSFVLFSSSPEQDERSMVERVLNTYLECSTSVLQNPFNEWGMSRWHSIKPKRMSDKIYLVLKKYGKPMHFTEITEQINKTRFDHKVAHAPTVHNELILDKRFVLVGRGIYALQEWGYKPGVVADVIASILSRAPNPLSREEIIDEVLKQRFVKKGTILLALTSHDTFLHLPDGRFMFKKIVSQAPETVHTEQNK